MSNPAANSSSAAAAAASAPAPRKASRGFGIEADSQLKLTQGILIGAQVTFCVLLGVFGGSKVLSDDFLGGDQVTTALDGYNFYIGVMIMMLVGFGYLMTFMKYYGLGAVGFCLLVTAIGLQWGLILEPFFSMWYNNSWAHFPLTIYDLYIVTTYVAAPLISLGAVIGKITPLQLVIMVLVEFVFHAIVAQVLLYGVLKVTDIGGTYGDHMFGCYFGLAVAYMLGRPVTEPVGGHNSDIFSLIGTVFLWVYWPSFVTGWAESNSAAQQHALVNTVLALCSSTVMAYCGSSIFSVDSRFRTVDIQNATLAGGVTIGCLANLPLNSGVCLVVGALAGLLSAYGYAFVQPYLCSEYGLHDTCGVNNLHGMPSILGGLISVLVAGVADASRNEELYYFNPAPQALMQFVGVVVTVAFAVGSGLLTGAFLKLFDVPVDKDPSVFHDNAWWEIGGDPAAEGKEAEDEDKHLAASQHSIGTSSHMGIGTSDHGKYDMVRSSNNSSNKDGGATIEMTM